MFSFSHQLQVVDGVVAGVTVDVVNDLVLGEKPLIFPLHLGLEGRSMKRDPQTAFEEKDIEDPDLEEMLTERDLSADAARRYAKANRTIKKHIAEQGYDDDVRYRCGEWVFRLVSNDRDGYEVGDGSMRRFAELVGPG